jgi:hypothetical protein
MRMRQSIAVVSIAVMTFAVVLLPFVPAWATDDASRDLSRAIDAQLEESLEAKGLSPAPRASDADLVRRIYLDILGRVPTAGETMAYLNDPAADKHHRLIDELLAHSEMPVYWRTVFSGWLQGTSSERPPGLDGFLAYLESRLAENRAWDDVARELLMPDVEDPVSVHASFFLSSRLQGNDREAQLDGMTTAVASVFFGVQLQCAKCHDHPFVDDWKQENYYGLAAFLGRVQSTRLKDASVLVEKAEGEVKFVNGKHEEKTARLIFLDNKVVDEPSLEGEKYEKGSGGLPDMPKFSRRQALVDLALNAQSPYFKRAMANRIWKQLMGVGLVEPVDQIHDANPATHPRLLEHLADDFAAHGFDLRRLMAGILHSEAYLRTSRWEGSESRPANSAYAVAVLKPLSPEQLAVSLAYATGHMETLRAKYEREAKGGKSPGEAHPRARYERERDYAEFIGRFANDGGTFEANAGQALFLTYNAAVQNMLKPVPGTLAGQLADTKDDAEAVRQAYLAVLSRPPSDEEVTEGAAFLATPGVDRTQLRGELVGSLATSAEFRFNH